MAHHPSCPNCSKEGTRNEKFDAYYCQDCDLWLEPKCSEVPLGNAPEGDPLCWFNCWERPDKPSQV